MQQIFYDLGFVAKGRLLFLTVENNWIAYDFSEFLRMAAYSARSARQYMERSLETVQTVSWNIQSLLVRYLVMRVATLSVLCI